MKLALGKHKHGLIFLLILAANLIPHIAVIGAEKGVLLNWYLTDDAFYYFKTAQNIAEGKGITYDGLSPTNGFHPLWMLVCIPVFALARFDLYLPLRLLVLVQVLLNAVSGYLLFRLMARHASQAAAWLAAAAWMFLPVIHGITTKLGLESGLNALTLIYLVYRVADLPEADSPNQPALWGVGLAAVLALLARLDNIFILILLGMWLVLRARDMRWHAQLDFLLIFLASITAYFLRMSGSPNLFNMLNFAYLLLAMGMVLKPLSLYIFGQYASDENTSLSQICLRTGLAVSLASVLMALVFFLLHDVAGLIDGYPRLVLLLDWALSLALLLGVRVLRKLRDQRFGHSAQDVRFSTNWKNWFVNGLSYFLPLLTALGLYMAANAAYAGSAMPVSGQIKRWWGTLPHTIYGQPIRTLAGVLSSLLDTNMESGPFWLLTQPLFRLAGWLTEFFKLPVSNGGGAHALMLVVVWGCLGALVLVAMQANSRHFTRLAERFTLMPLAVGVLMQALSYKASGFLHVRYWYWIGQMLLLLLLGVVLVALLLERLEKDKKMHTALVSAAKGVGALLWLSLSIGLLRDFPPAGNVEQLYDIEGEQRFLETHTRPGDVIGLTGGGLVGYFVPDRTILNLDGLINSPEYFDLLKQNRLDEYHRRIGTDFIYGGEQVLLHSDPYRWTYTNRLQLVAEYTYFNLYRYCQQPCP